MDKPLQMDEIIRKIKKIVLCRQAKSGAPLCESQAATSVVTPSRKGPIFELVGHTAQGYFCPFTRTVSFS